MFGGIIMNNGNFRFNEFGMPVGPMGEPLDCRDPRMMGQYGNNMHPQGNPYQQVPQNVPTNHNRRRPGKREVIEYFKNMMKAPDIDLVDDSYDAVARHVCLGGTAVELLPKNVYRMDLGNGEVVPMEYYQCPKCGKIILNRNFM